MPTLTVERSTSAPPEKVFALATDVHNFAEIVPAIVKVEVLTEGPVRVGTRFRETRVMFGREASEEMEFVELDPPRSYAVRAQSHGCRYHTQFRFVPEGSGTKMVMQFDAEPLTLMAKIMSTLMKPMMKKMGEMCAKDLEAIGARAESS